MNEPVPYVPTDRPTHSPGALAAWFSQQPGAPDRRRHDEPVRFGVPLEELLTQPPTRGDWGPWHLDAESGALHLPVDPNDPADSGDLYWVSLADCTSSAGVLDKVCQLVGKTWGCDEVVAGLVRALDDILDCQATLCSHGQDRRLTADQVTDRARQVSRWSA